MNRILITPGEPAGVGPDITVQIAQRAWPAELVVVADEKLLQTRAAMLGLPLKLIPFDPHAPASEHQPGTLKIISLPLEAPCVAGQLNSKNAHYVLRSLEIAADYCKDHVVQALVTGPVHKGIMNEAGLAFTGHTEFFAKRCGVDQSVMLFVTSNMKVALLTTHLSLSQVPSAVTPEKLKNVLRILQNELRTKFKITHPKIFVCGLNPHAGEQGHFGREEIDVIEPVLNALRKEKMDVTGPLSADTLFTEKYLQEADTILAMYHDQALPVVKYAGFGMAVNVTLGLPFIRTSVDHGTALDMAGTLDADPGSFAKALELAIQLI